MDKNIENTDPGGVGAKPKFAKALTPQAETTARVVDAFVDQAFDRLKKQSAANSLVLRGFSMLLNIPSLHEWPAKCDFGYLSDA